MERDEWLTAVSNIPSYRVSDIFVGQLYPDPGKWPAGFYSCRLATSNIAAAKWLAQWGFYIVDTAITLEREPFQPVTGGTVHRFHSKHGISIRVRDVQPQDYRPLLDIAEESFSCSRFALDPHIPRQTVSDIKRAWLGSYFSNGRGERVLVVASGNEAAGFLAVLQQPDAMVIDLIGVKAGERQQGIGRALTRHFCALYQKQTVRVGTQAANIPSLRLYYSLGFVPTKTEFVLHAHIG